MKIKVEVRERQSEKDPKLRGSADVTLGDVVIKDVAVKEFEDKFSEGQGSYYGVQMPSSRSYEKDDGTRVYVPAVEIKSAKEEDTKKIQKEVREIVSQAMTVEPNEYGKKVCEGEIDFDYNKDNIKTYVTPFASENNPNLRAFATAYIGNIVKINDIAMTEYTNKETNEQFTNINFPSKKIEKDGEIKYQEKVFTVGEGMRKNLISSIEENYLSELEKDQTQNQEHETEEEEEPEM